MEEASDNNTEKTTKTCVIPVLAPNGVPKPVGLFPPNMFGVHCLSVAS